MTAPFRDFACAEKVNATGGGTSSGKFSRKREKLTYRQFFAARWGEFVRNNFDSPEHAAHVFGVDGSTARKWFADDHAPSGFVVGMAYDQYPDQAAQFLRSAK